MARTRMNPVWDTEPPRGPKRSPWRLFAVLLCLATLGATGLAIVTAAIIFLEEDPLRDSERLREMGEAIVQAHAAGATFPEAFEQARAAGHGSPISGAPVRINPDEDAWRRAHTYAPGGDRPPLLVLGRHDEVHGFMGYWAYTASRGVDFLPKRELPDWAR